MLKSILKLTVLTSFVFIGQVHAAKIAACRSDACDNYFKQYKAAASRGHSEAMSFLGELYQAGYGTDKNTELALYYYKKAAKGGVVAAHYKAGLLYLSDPQHKDLSKGIRYLETAARKNFRNANFLLAIIYINRQFGLFDLAKADKYLAKTYNERHPDMPMVVEYIKEDSAINSTTFPKLAKAMNSQPLAKSDDGVLVWPTDDVEVMTITSPKVEEVLEQRLISFRRPAKSLGSRLPNNRCSDRIGCYSAFGLEGLKDFPFLRIQ